MSGQDGFDAESSQRNYTDPYTSKHPVPTIQRYREHRGSLDEHQKEAERAQQTEEDDSKVKQAFGAVKRIFREADHQDPNHNPYPTANRNLESSDGDQSSAAPQPPPKQKADTDTNGHNGTDQSSAAPPPSKHKEKSTLSASQQAATHTDPRQKRKAMKHTKRDDGGREVTDPVTHLPIVIRDSTNKDLASAPENEKPPGEDPRTMTGFSGASKSQTQLDKEREELDRGHRGMQKMFPPPSFDDAKAELAKVYMFALTIGLGSVGLLALLIIVMIQLFGIRTQSVSDHDNTWSVRIMPQSTPRKYLLVSLTVILSSIVGGALITGIRGWLGKKVEEIWEDEVWEAARAEEEKSHDTDSDPPESVAWLNSLLASVWPLINPDLFTSLADTLEDVMQASLPKLVQMVSVDDLGQGSESIRVLGVRWLPTGAASQTVDEDGNLEPAQSSQEYSDRTASDQGQIEAGDESVDNNNNENNHSKGQGKELSKKEQEKKKADEQEKQAEREGMEAEQGDFVNVELAFAYHARSSGKSLKTKARNAHLYLKFYFTGSIVIPVWVELRGIVGTVRLRLQLTPDPPFFSLCTLTFLGQPKADMSCVPLNKHSLNVMDVPLISGFVQSAIDAALAEYVAPKSLTLDLKEMLMGDDFKKDTSSRGLVAVCIKSAKGFKDGDGGFGPIKGSSDPYVSVSWGKFGKPVASTRIIVDEQNPVWDEWAYILVGPEEVNAEETLRLQVWDSDKYSADDDLGRVEVPLKELMHDSKTKNRMCDREDRLREEDPEEKMPGTISWSVGYFAKTGITDEQLRKQTEEEDIKSKEDLTRKVTETAKNKLREARTKDESKELEQQERQDYKEREDAMIIAVPPDDSHPSGLLSIQIHNITGLEIEQMRKQKGHKKVEKEDAGEDAENDDLPSSYCNIILNHRKIYRTRTKPKNAKPFFNAGTERFIKDWRTAEVIVSVRDAREGEDDALLGVVFLPLAKLFEKRCQINETYPIAGGVGYGRARISLIFRSTELKMAQELLGWDYGTLEVKVPVRAKDSLQDGLKGLRLKLLTNIGKAKLHAHDKHGEWTPRHHKGSMFLAVTKRYACSLTIEFRKTLLGPDSTAAFAVFWLKDIADDEDKTVTLKVYTGNKDAFKRAKSCNAFAEYVRDKEHKVEEVGEVELSLKFWPGLSGYHQKWADKMGSGSGDVKRVMEVLDVVGQIEGDDNQPGQDQHGDSDSENSSDDDGGGDGDVHLDGGEPKDLGDHLEKFKPDTVKSKLKSALDSHNDSDDGSRGIINQVRDYKDHRQSLHRKHRGIMQWRPVRKLGWMVGKVKSIEGSVEGVFKHGEREPGVETEV